jgi:hypothetical protein
MDARAEDMLADPSGHGAIAYRVRRDTALDVIAWLMVEIVEHGPYHMPLKYSSLNNPDVDYILDALARRARTGP